MIDYNILKEMKNQFSTKESVLLAAAKIISADTRESDISKSQYPNEQDIADINKGRN